MAYKKGHIHPQKIRDKISASRKGIKFSDEQKRKISKNHRKNQTEETKRKISKKMKGRKLSEETKQKISEGHSGEKSYLWRGGISFLPYSVDWTRSLRISIRERDKYTCQLCGEKQEEMIFSVHHIDYDKKNSSPNNLITLCGSCHIRTNHNRNYWIKYFKELIKNL